jgi:PAS domain S-box-containing protein
MFSVGGVWNDQNRIPVLLSSFAVLTGIAVVDWWTEPYFSLGFFYLFPIALAARFLPRSAVVALGCLCAWLSEVFSSLDSSNASIRLILEALALSGVGLLIADLVRKRRLTKQAEERLRVLVETNPAAIITADENGLIEWANRAATELIAPGETNLVGIPIATFFPELPSAWNGKEGPQLGGSAQCHARRRNGEPFLADIRVSTYREEGDPKLAVTVKDVAGARSSDASHRRAVNFTDRTALTARQVDVLRLLAQGLANKEIASRIGISESTVKNTLQQLFAKADVRTRSQLVCVALEQYGDLLSQRGSQVQLGAGPGPGSEPCAG